MTIRRRDVFLRVAAVSALLALALMVWALIDDSPFAMVFSMSAGQGLGTLSLVAWGIVAITDIRKGLRDRRWSLPPPGGSRPPPDRPPSERPP
jgi:hypothetical protein